VAAREAARLAREQALPYVERAAEQARGKAQRSAAELAAELGAELVGRLADWEGRAALQPAVAAEG
jgi:hypothetical protein